MISFDNGLSQDRKLLESIDDCKSEYYTVKELQSVFRCGRDKAYKIIKIPGFPVMEMFGTYLTHKGELKKWISRNYRTVFE